MVKSLNLYDVGTETAVRIDWPADDAREAVVQFRQEGRPAVLLPASVIELAAAVLRDPSVLQPAGLA